MNLSEVKRSYTLGKVPKQVESAMRNWISKYPTVSNAISELITNRMSDGILANSANYFFLDRTDQNNLVEMKIETNAKDMKSVFASLKQLQKAFSESPYKSIDYFLEILLLNSRTSDHAGGPNNSDAFKDPKTPENPKTLGTKITKKKLISPNPVKSVSIKIRTDQNDQNSPENTKKRFLAQKNSANSTGNKIRKLPSSVTIDVVKQNPKTQTGEQSDRLFNFSPLLMKSPSKQPKQVKVSIHRTPGQNTPLSSEKSVKNREVKISVVPDRAKRDLTSALNGPVALPVQSMSNLPKPSISPTKGVSIKIENDSKFAENNNFWTRPVLPGVVTNTSGLLPVSPATSSSVISPISVKSENPNSAIQGEKTSFPVVLQCIHTETIGDSEIPTVSVVGNISPIATVSGPTSGPSSKVPKQKYPSKFRCKICLKGFTRNTTLMTHMRTHTGERPYECSVCGKKFNTANYLKSHKLLHSGDRPFVCPVSECSKSFTQSATLRVHMKVHTGEKPHVCEYCNRSFATSGDLTKHVRTHTQERPYKCPVCFHGFNQNGNLRRHQQKLGHYDHKALHNSIRVKIIPKLEPTGPT